MPWPKSPAHASWLAMRSRVDNPRAHNYSRYGGRGIQICNRWRDFNNFLADMGERPPGMSIDRIDTDGHYEPGNCRWATGHQQAQNTRANRLTPGQVEQVRERLAAGATLTELARETGVSIGMVGHIRHGRAWAA